ncbi:MAG: AmmeMemoRadiSam system protein B [Spirochaetes bacterium]|jgi:hypothetical protein|nr:AmmeMemoRadiSam system protein B [Spirochaetota bacterium]
MWRRKPAVAGSFYPSDPGKLTADIDIYLNNAAEIGINGELFGLIVPHAGYVYSGPVAAYSYNLLKGLGVRVAVVLAPCHRARFDGASVIPSGLYATPLGDVTIDEAIGSELVKKTRIKFIREAHDSEHSLEVQVPFLQRVLGDFTLVPIVVGTTDLAMCRSLAAEMAEVLAGEERRFVVVISTDLSHYHPYEEARRIDGVFIETLKRYDTGDLYSSLSADRSQACGEGPVLTGLELGSRMGASRVEVLKYANSGDTAGGRDQVVGYLAAAIVK